MNFDFDLGKSDSNHEIITRIKLSVFPDVWYKFKEKDQFLRFHDRLKLLPSSQSEYRCFRKIRNRFIPKNVAKLYYDFRLKRLHFNKEPLELWTPPPTKESIKAQKLEESKRVSESKEKGLEKGKSGAAGPSATNAKFKQLMKINAMVSAGLAKTLIAKKLQITTKTVYRAIKQIENEEFTRKPYNSQSRFCIQANEAARILDFMVYQKPKTLNEIIQGCQLTCSRATLSRFLKSKGECFKWIPMNSNCFFNSLLKPRNSKPKTKSPPSDRNQFFVGLQQSDTRKCPRKES